MASAVTTRGVRPPAGRQAVALVVWWVVVTLLVLVVGKLLTGPLQAAVSPADDAVPEWFADHRSAPWTDAADVLTVLGDAVVTAALAVVLMGLVWWWRRERRAVVFVAVAVVGEFATWFVTVNLVLRHRPSVKRLDPGLDPLHSFPSGHVAAATAVYGGAAVLLWVVHRRHRGWWASLVPVLALALVVLIGVARLYLGVHHPTDVLASLVFMAVWLQRCAAVLLRPAQVTGPAPT